MTAAQKILVIVFGLLGICFTGVSVIILIAVPIMNPGVEFTGVLGGIFLVFGLGFLIPAIIIYRKGKKEQERIDELKAGGYFVPAVISDIQRDTMVRINDLPTYFMYAEYTDPETGRTYHFKSQRLQDDPGMMDMIGWYVPVYMEPGLYDSYYMDAEAAYIQDHKE
jgi:hypothetical protein